MFQTTSDVIQLLFSNVVEDLQFRIVLEEASEKLEDRGRRKMGEI